MGELALIRCLSICDEDPSYSSGLERCNYVLGSVGAPGSSYCHYYILGLTLVETVEDERVNKSTKGSPFERLPLFGLKHYVHNYGVRTKAPP